MMTGDSGNLSGSPQRAQFSSKLMLHPIEERERLPYRLVHVEVLITPESSKKPDISRAPFFELLYKTQIRLGGDRVERPSVVNTSRLERSRVVVDQRSPALMNRAGESRHFRHAGVRNLWIGKGNGV